MQPLADRMRPQELDDMIGQEHIIGKSAVLRIALESGHLPSMILYGPPGVGKTTLAKILAHKTKRPFYELSAVQSGVKDVRDALEKAKSQQFFDRASPILFIDEIHRFNKSQQDALLAAVEKGVIVLIGATTENPSFEVNSALLSRCQVYVLKPIDQNGLIELAKTIIAKDFLFKDKMVELKETDALVQLSGGDARKLCNIMELAGSLQRNKIEITNALISKLVQENPLIYDKGGEMHYDIASAFIKSIRGSDPNATLYWLARMISAGEDIRFIARRLLISAAEDIGLANPNALLIANACQQAVDMVGYPESRIILAEASIYLACSAKSNSAYLAIEKALAEVAATGNLPVPLSLRNPVTGLMKSMEYGKGYQYAHDFENQFIDMEFLPKELSGISFYTAGTNVSEEKIKESLINKWKNKYHF